PPSASELLVLDLPALLGEENDAGVYVAVAAVSPHRRWPGAILYEVVDGDLVERLQVGIAAVTGQVLEALPPGPVHYWDEANVLEVQLDDPGAVLLSRSRETVLRGANALLLGEEILQFREVVALGDGLWRLSGLLRGRLGTEAAVATHGAEERAVLLEAEGLTRLPLPLEAIGMARQLKAVTFETDPDLVRSEEHTSELQ